MIDRSPLFSRDSLSSKRRKRRKEGRFVVRSVSGWPVGPGGAGGKSATIWSVHDSAFGYRQLRPPSPVARYNKRGEKVMRAFAARLNAEDEAYQASLLQDAA